MNIFYNSEFSHEPPQSGLQEPTLKSVCVNV